MPNIAGSADRMNFVHALELYGRSRFLFAVWSGDVEVPNDSNRGATICIDRMTPLLAPKKFIEKHGGQIGQFSV